MFYSPHPLLRKRGTETATVSYSELLFDLIYVFSVTQLSHYLLHDLTWVGLLKETILWFAVWMLWQHTIWVTNWFNPDTRPIRMLPLSHIIAVVALALLLSWPYHISLLIMNILVTSVFIFVIVFDILFPDKGFKIK